MPVAIPVGARADESSFKQIADQAEEFFKASGMDVGKAFAEELADGMQSGEKAVQRSANKLATNYDKLADATGKVRVEQEKLKQLQESGARNDRIVAQTERVVKARRDESRALRSVISDFEDYGRAAEDAGRKAHSSFSQGFGAGFSRSHVGGFFSDLKAEAQSSGSMAGVLAGRAMGAGITAGLAAATGGIAAVVGGIGYTLTKGFQRYEAIDSAKHRLDNLNKTLAATGKAEINVKGVMDTVNDVVQGTPFSLPDAFGLATNALAAPTGDLKRFMTVAADSAGFAQENLGEIGDAFLKVANTGKLSMDQLNNEFRKLPLQPWLQETLHVSGGELTKMISDGQVGLEALLRTLEEHVPGFAKAAGDTIKGSLENMGTAVARVGAKALGAMFGQPTDEVNTFKEAIDAVTGKLVTVEHWVDAHQDSIKHVFEEAVSVAHALGGAIGWVGDHLLEVSTGAGAVLTAFTAWKTIKGVARLVESLTAVNTMLGVTLPASAATGAAGISAAFAPLLAILGPVAALVGAGAGAYTAYDIMRSKGRAERDDAAFRQDQQHFLDGTPVSPPEQGDFRWGISDTPELKAPPLPTTIDSGAIFGDGASLPMEPAPGGYGSIFGADSEDATSVIVGVPPKSAPGKPVEGAPAPGAPAGAPILAPPGKDSKGGKKDKAPLRHIDESEYSVAAHPVPGMSAMDVIAGGPTAGVGGVISRPGPGGFYEVDPRRVFDAETAMENAKHRVEEARMRQIELGEKGTASQRELLVAKNNVQEAERAYQSAEMKLAEARQGTLKKQTDALKGGLSELGAALDQDFGISKGLPGLAENITKFLANLAFAPALGALSAVVYASGGGVGAPIGMAGGMMPASASAAMLGGGYSGNVAAMMALAQSSSGKVKYGPASDLVHGLADCSGSISDLVEMLQYGHTTPGRLFTTTNFASDAEAAKLGFYPGFMPGALNVGVNPYPGQSGHMAATLPNGVNFEGGGGTGGGAQYGGSAAGADDPKFEKQYYMPIGQPPMSAPEAIAAPPLYGPQNTDPGLTGLPAAGLSAPDAIAGAGGGSGMGVPGFPGMAGPPMSAVNALAGGAPSAPMGIAPSVGAGGGGFQGMGGMPLDAAMTAASALDVLAPGAGMAAQKGIQLINRAIGYGGQLAGIGVQGLISTLLPRESPLADMGNSWFGRLASGFAGVRPAGQNMAGQSTLPNPDDARKKGQQSRDQAGNTINNNVNMNLYDASQDEKAREATAAVHGMMQNSAAGPRG